MISPDYSLFIHSLATELEFQAGEEESDALLHSVGQRMAERLPLPSCKTTEAFEMECNANLALIGWGRVDIHFDQEKNGLQLNLRDFPRVGALGKIPGLWFASFYAGLFTAWFKQMGEVVTIRSSKTSDVTTLVLVIDTTISP